MSYRNLHLQDYDRKINCNCCNEYTWHKFIKHEPVIIVPIHRIPEERKYYLSGFGVYQCLKCCKQTKTPSLRKRVSKTEAEKLQIPQITNIAFILQICE